MKSTINVSLRIPSGQARLIKRAARMEHKPLATFIRDVAVAAAAERVVRDQPLPLEAS